MNVKNFLKGAATQANQFKDGIDKSKMIALARDEVHQFAYGVIVKQLVIFSSAFFVIGFLAGCLITWAIS